MTRVPCGESAPSTPTTVHPLAKKARTSSILMTSLTISLDFEPKPCPEAVLKRLSSPPSSPTKPDPAKRAQTADALHEAHGDRWMKLGECYFRCGAEEQAHHAAAYALSLACWKEEYRACFRKLCPISAKFVIEQQDRLVLLLDHGADIMSTDSFGSSALTWAVREGHTACADLLIQHGAEASDGREAVFWACRAGRPASVAMLLERGASPDAADKYALQELRAVTCPPAYCPSLRVLRGERRRGEAMLDPQAQHGQLARSESESNTMHGGA